MSSRLARDRNGRLIVEMTTPGEAGKVLWVLGNDLECAGRGIGFLGTPTRRHDTAKTDREWVPIDAPRAADLCSASGRPSPTRARH